MKEIDIVNESLKRLCIEHRGLFKEKVSEQAICAALSQCMYFIIINKYPELDKYFVDVEYNRGFSGRKKVIKGCDVDGMVFLKNIICDLVVHNRGGKTISPENLIAIEMKKTTDCLKKVTNEDEKNFFRNKREADIMRLRALTSNKENLEGYSMYSYPRTDESKSEDTEYTVEGFQLGVFIELCDKYKKSYNGQIKLPEGWRLDSISSLKISFFINGKELFDKSYKIQFTNESFAIKNVKLIKVDE